VGGDPKLFASHRTKSPFTAQQIFPVESLIRTITFKIAPLKISHRSRKKSADFLSPFFTITYSHFFSPHRNQKLVCLGGAC
jgi:hypothetical protein